MIEPRNFNDDSRPPVNFEELYVVCREGKQLIVDGINTDGVSGTLTYDERGEWWIPGDERGKMPDAWLLPADSSEARLLRRIIGAAHALSAMSRESVASYVRALASALAQPADTDSHQEAQRLIERATLLQADMSSLRTALIAA
jgi:hypothetical protein